MIDILLGFMFSLTVTIAAYYKKSLNESGVITALVIGTILYYFGGWFAFLFLIVFFVSASGINLVNPVKAHSNRTSTQVLANGGFAAFFAILYYLSGDVVFYYLIFVSITVSASDTFSSEIGRLYGGPPKHILTFKKMAAKLSGGVTLIGFFASLVASFVFAFLSYLVIQDIVIVLLIAGFGFLGSIIDSLLGVIQVKYQTPKGDLTEIKAKEHEIISGLPWLNNNGVNILSNGITIVLFLIILLTSV